jgi:beta-glucosidase
MDPTVVIEGILNDSNLSQISTVASRADTCLVFVSADSGKGYITVEGNFDDRDDLNLWHGGDALLAATLLNARTRSSYCTLSALS